MQMRCVLELMVRGGEDNSWWVRRGRWTCVGRVTSSGWSDSLACSNFTKKYTASRTTPASGCCVLIRDIFLQINVFATVEIPVFCWSDTQLSEKTTRTVVQLNSVFVCFEFNKCCDACEQGSYMGGKNENDITGQSKQTLGWTWVFQCKTSAHGVFSHQPSHCTLPASKVGQYLFVT